LELATADRHRQKVGDDIEIEIEMKRTGKVTTTRDLGGDRHRTRRHTDEEV